MVGLTGRFSGQAAYLLSQLTHAAVMRRDARHKNANLKICNEYARARAETEATQVRFQYLTSQPSHSIVVHVVRSLDGTCSIRTVWQDNWLVQRWQVETEFRVLSQLMISCSNKGITVAWRGNNALPHTHGMDVISRHYIESEGLPFVDTRAIEEYFKNDIATGGHY